MDLIFLINPQWFSTSNFYSTIVWRMHRANHHQPTKVDQSPMEKCTTFNPASPCFAWWRFIARSWAQAFYTAAKLLRRRPAGTFELLCLRSLRLSKLFDKIEDFAGTGARMSSAFQIIWQNRLPLCKSGLANIYLPTIITTLLQTAKLFARSSGQQNEQARTCKRRGAYSALKRP